MLDMTDMNPSVAISLNNLAGLYHKLGGFDRATGLYGKALEIRRAVLGESHEDTLLVGENLKLVEADKRKWVAAVGSSSSSSKGKEEDDYSARLGRRYHHDVILPSVLSI